VGINLATNEPTPQALREAIRNVLDKPNYRSRASVMAKEFAGIDTRSEILRILKQVSGVSDKDKGRRVAGRIVSDKRIDLGQQPFERQIAGEARIARNWTGDIVN
jgi:hypothetical protein